MRFSTRLHLADRSSRPRELAPFRYDPAVEAARPQWAHRRATATPAASLRPAWQAGARRTAGTGGAAGKKVNAGVVGVVGAARRAHLRVSAGKAKAGLAGQALPANVDAEALELDPGVAAISQTVAADGVIEVDDAGSAVAAQLALVNPATNTDKYYVLQLIDCNGGDKYVYRRHGRTGARGAGQLDGPFGLAEAMALFGRLFAKKTGQTWAARDPAAKPGNPALYSYLHTNWAARGDEAATDGATWRYHLTSDPQGKPNGWYAYDPAAGSEVEALYLQWAVDGNADMAVRCIHAESSGFSYRVDLTKMTQTNTSSSKARAIRRDTTV